MNFKKLSVISIAFVLALGLTIQPAAAKLSLGVDGAGTFQALSSQTDAGMDNDEEMGFGSTQANLHIYGDIAQGVEAYSEVAINPSANVAVDDAGDVRFIQGYITFTDLIPKADLKLGSLEVNFGNQHLNHSTNGDVMDNKLVGNHLVSPVATQTGLELSGNMKPVAWSFSVTNGIQDLGGHSLSPGGTGSDFTTTDRGWAYNLKVWGEFGPGITGGLSYYMNDQSDNPCGAFCGTVSGNSTAGNLFGTQTVVYEGLAQGVANFNVGPDMGNGQDVSAWQLDLGYEAPVGTKVNAYYGNMSDDDYDGTNSMAEPTDDWDYYNLQVSHPLTPEAYVAARYGVAEGERSVAGTTTEPEFEKIQVGAGYYLNENTVTKLEYVTQGNETSGTYRTQGAAAVGSQAEFDGVVAQMGVSF